MTDMLSAMSTVITCITILYTLWYHDIETVLKTDLPKHKADQDAPRKANRTVLRFKAVPLCIVSVLFFGIFLPESVTIVGSWICALKAGTYAYNPIQAAIVFINVLGGGFTVLMLCTICKMKEYC